MSQRPRRTRLRACLPLRLTAYPRGYARFGDLGHRAHASERGPTLCPTEEPIDTSTAAGKCFLDMLGVFAEFQTNLRGERQFEGIAKAKAQGVYNGCWPSIELARVREPTSQRLGAIAIASASAFSRVLVVDGKTPDFP